MVHKRIDVPRPKILARIRAMVPVHVDCGMSASNQLVRDADYGLRHPSLLVSCKALWVGMGSTYRVAGLGGVHLMDSDFSLWYPLSDDDRQSHALGFHGSHGHLIASH